MQNQNEIDELLNKLFEKIYRKCKSTNALKKGKEAIISCVSEKVGALFSVDEVMLNEFNREILGYKITIENKSAFFPKFLDVLETKNRINELRSTFLEVELVLPPFFSLVTLHTFAECIRSDSSDKFRNYGISLILSGLYQKASVASFCVGIYKENKSISPFFPDIIGALEVYYFGRTKSAILTLIPPIEGIIRNLGNLVDESIKGKVGVDQFISVLKKIQNHDIKNNIFKDYDWFPRFEMNIEFFDKYHERIQLIGSIIYYLEQSLYAHSSVYTKSSGLNRHGAIHAFFQISTSQKIF